MSLCLSLSLFLFLFLFFCFCLCLCLCCWQRDLNVFAREELSLKVVKVCKERAVSRQKAFSSRPFQSVLIQTQTHIGDALRVAMKPIMTVTCFPPVSKVILFPTNTTPLPVPSRLKTNKQGGVSAHLPTFHRPPQPRCCNSSPSITVCDTPGLLVAVDTTKSLNSVVVNLFGGMSTSPCTTRTESAIVFSFCTKALDTVQP